MTGLAAAPAQAASRPMPIGVTNVRVTTAGENQVRVTWSGGGQTTKYAFVAGASSMTDQRHFETGWYAANDRAIKARSVTLTVPAALRPELGAGSGGYVFVKVVQTNSTSSPAKCVQWTPSTLCRASASGSTALAGNGTAPTNVTTVSVASWNVQSITSSAGFSTADQWQNRLPKVVNNVELTKPDLIGFQELTTARTDSSCANAGIASLTAASKHCQEQYETLQARLKNASVPYTNVGSDAWLWLYNHFTASQRGSDKPYVDSALFYQPTKLRLVRYGFVAPKFDLGISDWGQGGDEAGVWAIFTTLKAPQRSFVAASIHFQVGADSQTQRVRAEEGKALAAFLAGKAKQSDGTSLPIVITADLNSTPQVDSSGAATLRGAGYFDTAATQNRTGQLFSTANPSNGTGGSDSGYPVIATPHPYPTSRIDYVLMKDPSGDDAVGYSSRFSNLIRLRNGRFDTRYNGSDHNMQYTVLGIVDPA